jgi:K+-transporting ATPase ATPase C chain
MNVMKVLRPALTLLAFFTVLTGLAYPLFVTAAAQALFPDKANGSLIYRDGKAIGSALIGQQFDRRDYFWGRLSATGGQPYNGMASGGTNYGVLHPGLVDAARARIDSLRAGDPTRTGPVPMDLVSASASGLDPHISIAAAEYQAERIARARGIPVDQVKNLIREHTEGRFFGIIGIARVNVLKLNLALDGKT